MGALGSYHPHITTMRHHLVRDKATTCKGLIHILPRLVPPQYILV